MQSLRTQGSRRPTSSATNQTIVPMARPRSRSRSTIVKVPGSDKHGTKGKRKRKSKSDKKDANSTAVTWDYDNSDSDDVTPNERREGKVENSKAQLDERSRRSEKSGDQVLQPVVGPSNGNGVKASFNSSLKRRRPTNDDSPDVKDHISSVPSGSDDDSDTRQADNLEQEDEDEDEDDKEGSDDDVNKDETLVIEEQGEGGGGMGDVMARILGQKVDSRSKAPVLAKRKTKTMKEMEFASVQRAESKEKSAARRANMTQQFTIPDHTTAEYERQLKKIATRGVVALFNAISKRQKEGGEGKNARGSAKTAAVKAASKHAFLDMLKTGAKPPGNSAGVQVGSGGKNGDTRLETGGNKSWSVLKDDYMLGASTMKNWDQQSGDSEEDALGGSVMSGDDSE